MFHTGVGVNGGDDGAGEETRDIRRTKGTCRGTCDLGKKSIGSHDATYTTTPTFAKARCIDGHRCCVDAETSAKMMYRNKKILKAAEGEDCTMHSPMCNGDRATVVFCHSNMQVHGKGRGLKSQDIFGFFGCSGCHRYYDQSDATKEEKEWYFWRAMSRTWLRLLQTGVLK